jgi:hypothetical protein
MAGWESGSTDGEIYWCCLNGMEMLRWRAGGARVSVEFVRSSVGQGCKDPLASAVQPAHLSKVNK